MNLEITQKEETLLKRILKNRISDYYMEIRHARVSVYKDVLKQKKQHLIALKEMLEQADTTNKLTITHAQTENLRDCLDDALQENASEIWHTDNSQWKAELINEKKQLQGLLQKVEALSVNPAV